MVLDSFARLGLVGFLREECRWAISSTDSPGFDMLEDVDGLLCKFGPVAFLREDICVDKRPEKIQRRKRTPIRRTKATAHFMPHEEVASVGSVFTTSVVFVGGIVTAAGTMVVKSAVVSATAAGVVDTIDVADCRLIAVALAGTIPVLSESR